MSATWRAPFTDAITSATPLGLFKSSGQLTPLLDLLLGTTTGSTGELFRIGIIAGGLFLMATRVANWRVPLSYLATVFVLSFVGNLLVPAGSRRRCSSCWPAGCSSAPCSWPPTR